MLKKVGKERNLLSTIENKRRKCLDKDVFVKMIAYGQIKGTSRIERPRMAYSEQIRKKIEGEQL